MKKILCYCLIAGCLALSMSGCGIQMDVAFQEPEENLTETELPSYEDSEYIQKDEQYRNAFVGGLIPDLQMNSLSGEALSLRDQSLPYVLVLSDTHCPACTELLPATQALVEEGVRVLYAYPYNTSEEIEILHTENDVLLKKETTLSGIDDLEGNNIQELFEIHSFPTLFFVNAEGVVTHIEFGTLSPESLRDLTQVYLF